ncbi:DNA-binding transcriptional regulator, GntR family [Sphaerochaeta associata]|uniref:GntR family transcriptional regulator n=1 Tax=Sphaerochaeta associata TaxID=1129264 RepID=A0ABY4D948_9SPIR|nr:GntR family transcriptional regulator [Sphaerochaeta associata]UOM50594.1 GntR family transcriptional regulator [Sphaerochaeta associata]SMP40310.1 DNA-binding transcriptional regulator, GntR family [Sphaerochaeta associata]
MEQKSNLKSDAYQYIKDKILTCEIMPGQAISEKQIMETFGIGRTPVREALIMLQSENLVEAYPRSGTIAKPITLESVYELFELRKLLEPNVATQFVRNIGLEGLLVRDRSLKSFCNPTSEQSTLAFYQEDIALHAYLISCTQNTQLIALCKPLFEQSLRVGMLGAKSHTSSSSEQTYREHNRIVKAILEEDTQEIHNAFISHLNAAKMSAIQSVKNQ